MEVSKMIAIEIAALQPEQQAKVLDFIKRLKAERVFAVQTAAPRTVEEITAFFRGFNVDTSRFKFDRNDANAR